MTTPTTSFTTPYSLDESRDPRKIKPKFLNILLEDFKARQPTAQELLAKALNERAMAGREAVDMRRQELLDRGELGMLPVRNPALLNTEILNRMPTDQRHRFTSEVTELPTETRVVPGIGHVTNFGDQGRVVTGRYGTGSVVNSAEPNPNRIIEGLPAAEWFKQAAIRQGADNKYARAEATGKTDKLGRPILKAVEIPAGSDASTERIFEGMKSGKYVPAKGGWQSKTA